ncbi:helix-turn-helix domain-containing protein [Deinococcus hopiensis]|uniref:helix-turn-helix domain-containing protein n=1 Tax=Deinococcus hopiensis TaxID=309885 RepID=UPI0009FEDBC4
MEKLREERFWNATMLCAELSKQCGVVIGPRALSNHLKRMGYSWKRARYAPAKTLDPEVVHGHQASLETLKRRRWTANSR